jgi:flagellar assembly protein FliH
MAAVVIKSGDTVLDAALIAQFELDSLSGLTDEAMRQADRDANSIRAQAEFEAERIRADARDQGYALGLGQGQSQGRQEGRQEAIAKFQSSASHLSSSLEAALAEVENSKRNLISRCHRDLIRLAIVIAERILKASVERDSSIAIRNVEAAVDLVSATTDLEIRMNPKEALCLRDSGLPLLHRIQVQRHVELVEDESITPGGCLIKTADGDVDAQLETQLEQIVAEILPTDTEHEHDAD